MIEKDFSVSNKLGLHARPASSFVSTTGRFQCDIKVTKDGQTVDGKSIMGLLMLAAGPGTPLRITFDGLDEQEAVAALDDLFARQFDDED